MIVLIREVMDLETFHQFMYLRILQEDCWNYDECRRVFRYAAGRIHSRQQTRRGEGSQIPVENRNCQIARRNEREQRCYDDEWPTDTVLIHDEEQQTHD